MKTAPIVAVLAAVLLQGCAFIPHDKALVTGEQRAQPVRDGDAWVFANGRFLGEVVEGQPSGPGTFITPDGTRVEATFNKGIAESGRVSDSRGTLVHDGAFVNGQWPLPGRIALGEEQFAGLIYGGAFAEGELTDARGETFAFVGTLLDGKPHGMATLTDKASQRQQVPYDKGIREGKGRLMPARGDTVTQYWQDGALIYSHPDVAVLGRADAPRCKSAWGSWVVTQGQCTQDALQGTVTLYRPDGQGRFIGRQRDDGLLEGAFYDHAEKQRIEGTFLDGLMEGFAKVTVNQQLVYEGPVRSGRYEGTGYCRYQGQMEPCQHAAGVRNDPTHQVRLAVAEQQRQVALANERAQQANRERQRAEEEAEEREERRRRQQEDEETARVIGQAILGVGQQVGQAYADMAEGEARVRADNAARQAEYDRQQEAERAAARYQTDAERREQLAQTQLQHNSQLAELQRKQREWEANAAADAEASQRAYNEAQRARSQARQSSKLLGEASVLGSSGAQGSTESTQGGSIAWPEGIAVCKPASAASRPDDLHCSGPFSTGVIGALESRVRTACGSAADRGDGIREYAGSGEWRVFGCGFGINPEKAHTNTWHTDQVQRQGLGSVPGRRGYRCPGSQLDPCYGS